MIQNHGGNVHESIARSDPSVHRFRQPRSTAAYDAVDAAIAQAMQAGWIAFARIGVPCHPDGSPWPSYESTAPLLTWIEDELTTRPLEADALTTLIQELRSEDY